MQLLSFYRDIIKAVARQLGGGGGGRFFADKKWTKSGPSKSFYNYGDFKTCMS